MTINSRNPLDWCFDYLKKADLDSLTLVWDRHQSEMPLTDDVILNLLEDVPRDWSVQQRLKWMQKCSSKAIFKRKVANWCLQTAKRYEVEERKNWPRNGLEFAKGALNVIKERLKSVVYNER